jgi:hypothetical protein
MQARIFAGVNNTGRTLPKMQKMTKCTLFSCGYEKGQTKLRCCLFNDINLKEKMALPKGKLLVTCGIDSGMGHKVANIFAKKFSRYIK